MPRYLHIINIFKYYLREYIFKFSLFYFYNLIFLFFLCSFGIFWTIINVLYIWLIIINQFSIGTQFTGPMLYIVQFIYRSYSIWITQPTGSHYVRYDYMSIHIHICVCVFVYTRGSMILILHFIIIKEVIDPYLTLIWVLKTQLKILIGHNLGIVNNNILDYQS